MVPQSFKFAQKDEELHKRIEAYQKRHKIKAFPDAVRQLLESALNFEKAVSKIK